MARLLNVYQLWLDDLYPRAKFADGLAIIEKIGHTKRMQTMRREWIKEGKPWESGESLDGLAAGAEKLAGEQTSSKSGQDQSWGLKSRETSQTPVAIVGDDDDYYAATPKSARDDRTPKSNGDSESLFLEDLTKTVPTVEQKPGSPSKEQNFEDDEDALLALNNMW